jgi:putative redox protein
VADVRVAMRWSGVELRFSGGKANGPEIAIDGDGVTGPSPVTALVLGIAGCMAADVVDIGLKMRLPIKALHVEAEADRRTEPPRRLTAVRLKYVVTGVATADEPKVWRAIELSRDTYCSVLHSLKDDIRIGIDLELRQEERHGDSTA